MDANGCHEPQVCWSARCFLGVQKKKWDTVGRQRRYGRTKESKLFERASVTSKTKQKWTSTDAAHAKSKVISGSDAKKLHGYSIFNQKNCKLCEEEGTE